MHYAMMNFLGIMLESWFLLDHGMDYEIWMEYVMYGF